MAADGIAAQVLFPSQALFIYEQFFGHPVDLELAHACERVYNDWMQEYCAVFDIYARWGCGISAAALGCG
jgi:hypothetical protein